MAAGLVNVALYCLMRFYVLTQHAVGGSFAPTLFTIVGLVSMGVSVPFILLQRDFKRLLAYSSVAHAGYALVGLAALNEQSHGAVLFYAAIYMVMQVGAFGVVAELERKGEGLNIEDYAGLSTRRPVLAAVMAVFLFSLTGIPPFGGFFGNEPILTVEAFADRVKRGEVRYVLLGGLARPNEITRWVRANGDLVGPSEWRSLSPSGRWPIQLYDLKPD